MSTLDVERVVAGRYRTTSLLHQGQGVDTFLATDLDAPGEEPRAVVVKIAADDSVTGATRRRLEHESAVLGRLDHPNLVRLLDRGRDGGRLYLVTPWVPGRSLAARLGDGPLPVRDAVTVACDVVAALCHAHDLGILHRDVKPANIVVDGDPVSRAVLIDFGLSRSDLLDPDMRDVPVGSVRYLAPEQTGLITATPDERSDLHAVGLVLLECLLGRPVHDGHQVGEVLKQQMTATPPRLDPSVPRLLGQIAERLIRRDPAERYQTAAALAHDLDELAGALDRGIPDPSFVLGSRDRRETLAEPGFVGREAEVARLEHHVGQASLGQGGIAFLAAESGGGKSRLLGELVRRVPEGALRLHGQGLDQAAQRPFQVLSGVVRDLVRAASEDPALAEGIRLRLGDRGAAAAVAFPELAPVLGIAAAAPLGPDDFGEVRTVHALSGLLDALGTADRPALVVLDDCQWADDLSARLLAHWSTAGADPNHVLVVAAYRSDELPVESVLRRIEPVARVELPPLADGDVAALVTSMAGAVPDEAVDVVVRLAEGSPFMAAAVLRGLVEADALVSGPDGWTVDPSALADVRSSRRAATVLAHRITLLGAETRRLLAVGAVLGKEFEIAVAAALGGVDPVDVARSVREASRRHLVWTVGADRCSFVHDKIREALLDRLDPDERSHLHERTATMLEERSPTRFFDLAFHFDAAGQPERALPYALAAADEARAQQSLELAEQQYRIAQRGAGADDARRRHIAEELGRVLMLRGRYQEAAVELAEARRLADQPGAIARIDGLLGELAFKRGDMVESSAALERALRALAQRMPTRGWVLHVAWEVLVQAAHTLGLARTGRRSADDAVARDLLAARLYSRLAHTYWFQKGSLATLYVHLRGLNLTERHPVSAERAQAYSEHAPVMSLLPWYRRGIEYAERSHAIRVELGDLYGQGQSRHFHGLLLYAATRWQESGERCREAVRLLDRTGDRWEANTARWHIGYAAYRQGDLATAAEVGEAVWRSGLELGDPQARGIGLAVWAKATDGLVPADAVAAEVAELADDVHTAAEVLTAEALLALRAGDPARAVQALERADDLVRAAGLRQEYVAPVPAWLLTARRALRASEPGPPDLRRRRRELHQARRQARRSRRLARAYRNNLAHALRESALVEAELGRTQKARRWLDRSIEVAEALGARQELALSQVARATVGLREGWPGAADELAAAQADLDALHPGSAALDAPVTLSIADRFESLLAAGRTIASTLEVDAVLHALASSAAALLRPQDCLVLSAPGLARHPDVGALTVVTGTGAEPSRSLLAEVLAGDTAVVRELLDADASDSLLLSGVRSVLCAPVRVRGESVGCLYVTHRELGGVFGEDEIRIAGFLTALAGGALENAEGFAEIQALTESLEDRIVERTGELRDANAELDERVAELRQAYEREQQITERLRRLDQFRTELIAITAHDLRTPLTIILGFAQTLTDFGDRLGPEEQVKLLQRIISNTRRLSEFVDNLLQFARIESGELEVAHDPVDLPDLVRRTVAEMAAHESRREFHLDIADDVPTVLADESRQWQVLMNLLSNAAKHSAPDAPITVAVARQGDVVEVAVTDRGAGIPAAELPKLFAKFSRVDSAAAKQAMGTGLGLYICRSLVEAHGGTIRVESEEGVGTTFTYEVPIEPRPRSASGG